MTLKTSSFPHPIQTQCSFPSGGTSITCPNQVTVPISDAIEPHLSSTWWKHSCFPVERILFWLQDPNYFYSPLPFPQLQTASLWQPLRHFKKWLQDWQTLYDYILYCNWNCLSVYIVPEQSQLREMIQIKLKNKHCSLTVLFLFYSLDVWAPHITFPLLSLLCCWETAQTLSMFDFFWVLLQEACWRIPSETLYEGCREEYKKMSFHLVSWGIACTLSIHLPLHGMHSFAPTWYATISGISRWRNGELDDSLILSSVTGWLKTYFHYL